MTTKKTKASAAKKAVAKKPATKAKANKTVAKKPATKAKANKTVAKKPATKAKAKKTVAKKPATKAKAKKTVAKKPATKAKAKKTVTKKPVTKAKTKKTVTKKSATKDRAKAKKAVAKKPVTKAKKTVAKKPATKAKNTVAKKPATKAKAKNTVAKKPATKAKAKKTVAKKPATKPVAKKAPVKKAATNQATNPIPLAKNPSVAREREAASNKATPIAFSFDDVEALVATRKKEIKSIPDEASVKKKLVPVKKKAVVEDKPVKKRVLGAASLADILGFNPAEKKKVTSLEDESIPKKWKKYYKLLLNLRQHVSDELDLHTSDTLQHASRDEGDRKLESDAGTDAFDRDFALSLVSSEQEALNEVEEAILRIKQGTYGVCEVTGKTISKDRLAAVPFARYSIEGQAEFEKNQRRKIERIAGGLFADSADAPKITSDDDD